MVGARPITTSEQMPIGMNGAKVQPVRSQSAPPAFTRCEEVFSTIEPALQFTVHWFVSVDPNRVCWLPVVMLSV